MKSRIERSMAFARSIIASSLVNWPIRIRTSLAVDDPLGVAPSCSSRGRIASWSCWALVS